MDAAPYAPECGDRYDGGASREEGEGRLDASRPPFAMRGGMLDGCLTPL